MKVSKQNIKNLLSSVSSDGRGAFERFYNLYYDQVFRFAYSWRERGLQGGRVRRVLFYLEIKSTLKRDRQYRYLLVYNGTQRSASSYFKKQ